jgi:hypothetical protein
MCTTTGVACSCLSAVRRTEFFSRFGQTCTAWMCALFFRHSLTPSSVEGYKSARSRISDTPCALPLSEASSGVYTAGTFAPLRLASESPMAMVCCLLLTRVPLLPLFNVPSLSLCIARLTDRCALFPNLAIMYSFLKRGTRVRPCEPTLFKRKEGARGSKQRILSSIFLV